MMVSILGESIRLIRPDKIHKPTLPSVVWKSPRKSRPVRIRHTVEELMDICKNMGFEWTGRLER